MEILNCQFFVFDVMYLDWKSTSNCPWFLWSFRISKLAFFDNRALNTRLKRNFIAQRTRFLIRKRLYDLNVTLRNPIAFPTTKIVRGYPSASVSYFSVERTLLAKENILLLLFSPTDNVDALNEAWGLTPITHKHSQKVHIKRKETRGTHQKINLPECNKSTSFY